MEAEGVPLAKEVDGDAEPDPELVQRILDRLDFADWVGIADDAEAILVEVYQDGGAAGVSQVGAPPSIVTQVNEAGVAWGRDRAAELVGMRVQADGTRIPNPDARWTITEGTRERIRSDVTRALREGLSADDFADAIEESYAFSPARARMVARTEVVRAHVAGNVASWRVSGMVEGKEWLLDSDACPICQAAAALGVVPLDDDFGGRGDPPGHPNCGCAILPVLAPIDD